ncbi:hypothetical protein ACNGHC_03605 [Campylobacter jejuni]|uniref:hypothetical protein n=1 Tax=Campylobacter coli TaxID=195 RepID=UPI0012F00FC8|nr:hypothetical protein [Campylobacter coli]ECQ9132823.1 hypothetical protein [Campylobacter jejuni]MCH3763280.1 hypothetical protein [Campylobacter coli]
MKNIKIFLDKLQSWNKHFKITDYQYDKYNCEISDFFKMSLEIQENKLDFGELLEYWRNIFSKDYFELYHPIYNNIKTRAIKNFFAPKKHPRFSNYVFFIDENNQHPWILCQVYDFFQFLITEEGIFSNPISHKGMKEESIWDIRRLPMVIDENIGLFENIKYNDDCLFGWLLRKNRPAHHFFEDIASYNILEIQKSMFSKESYYTPKVNILPQTRANVFIYPGIFRSLGNVSMNIYKKSNQKIYEEIVKERIKTTGRNVLIVWLQLPGERRRWIEQIDGSVSIINEYRKYFKNVKVYFDGMTSFDEEKTDFPDNYAIFEQIKSKITDGNIELHSMIGKDYRTKIFYCSQVDFAICETGTAMFVPNHVCNKKTVVYYGYKTYENADCYFTDNIYKIDSQYIKLDKLLNNSSFEYHIPFQHIFNLTTNVIEKVKGVKVHCLEVPPVDLIADCYELKQKYKTRFPIEYVALYNEYKDILNNKIELLSCEIQKIQNAQSDINKRNEIFLKIIQKKELECSQILEEKYQCQISDLILNNKIIKHQNQDLLKKINENAYFIYLKEYESAKARIREHLAYKLGHAMIVNSKSLLGYIRMPFVLSYIKDKHKQEQKIYQEKIKKDLSLKLPSLESYPDYKEALKEKECLTYKLGEALIKANNNWYRGGYIKLWFEIRKLRKDYQKEYFE